MSPLPFPPVELPHYIKQVREDAPSRILSLSQVKGNNKLTTRGSRSKQIKVFHDMMPGSSVIVWYCPNVRKMLSHNVIE